MKKRNQNKKQSKKITISFRRRLLVTSAVILLAGISLVSLSVITARSIATAHTAERLARIEGIYKSLELSDKYRIEGVNVFGEKRVYDWDSSRTFSSSMEYLRGENVDVTFAEVDRLIKEAGFEFIDEPYPGAISKQHHYKSNRGEYIRLTVSSKLYDDAFLNAFVMDSAKLKDVSETVDVNAGPSNVLIKVNLDDNNE